MDALALAESTRLAELESTIDAGLRTFVDVGNALLEIRDSRLYRQTFGTFEDYCRERWGFNSSRARQLIGAAETVRNLESVTTVTLFPATESQARPLTRLEPEQQREAWQRAVETAPNGKVTAAHVQATVDEYRAPVTTSETIARPHVSFNSGNNEWYTPAEYIEAARKVLGRIDLDPASSAIANHTVKATIFYTAEDDGLAQEWKGSVWMNPPYAGDLVGRFVAKLVCHIEQYDVREAIVLVNNATETAWFQELAIEASAIVFPRGRIRYLRPDGLPDATGLQGQAFVYIGQNEEVFLAEFARFGWGAIIPRFTTSQRNWREDKSTNGS